MTVKIPTVIHIGSDDGSDDEIDDDEISHSSTLSSLSDFASVPRSSLIVQQRRSGFAVIQWDKETRIS